MQFRNREKKGWKEERTNGFSTDFLSLDTNLYLNITQYKDENEIPITYYMFYFAYSTLQTKHDE